MPTRPSWRPLVAGTVALFFVILAFLAGQLKSGGDPALGRSSAAQQTSQPQTTDPGFGTGPSTDPSAPDDGFVPGGTAPAPAVPDGSSDAPTTHQS
jgi:hypothetical protein